MAAVLPRFLGDVSQIPPMVSAVHHEGRRLYELAREGVTVERAARTIRIDALTMADFVPGEVATATLEVSAARAPTSAPSAPIWARHSGWGGTWRPCAGRASARSGSRRRRRWPTLTEENLPTLLVSPADALDSLPAHRADNEADADAIRHGRALPSPLPPDTVARILDAQGALLALGRADGEQLRPFKVFAL